MKKSGEAYSEGREFVLGQYETLALRPDQYVTLAQIRGERNVVTDELKESILRQGLINLPDTSLLTHEALAEYIAFTNRTWGADVKIEQFTDLRMSDGRYPLIKSGLSRFQAITELIAEERLSRDTILTTKLSPAQTVWDIVQWQIDENIHSQPPQERRAMALVESYRFGLQQGDWSSEDDFVRIQQAAGHDVKKGPLNQALKYAKLEPRIRNFILAGHVPYLAGVEMGATVDVLTEYVARLNGFDGVDDLRITPEHRKTITSTATIELDIICSRIAGDRLNSTASKRLVQGRRTAWGELARQLRPNGRAHGQVLQFEFAQDQLERYRAIKQRELEAQLRDLARKYHGADVADFLQLQRGILHDDDVAPLLHELEEGQRRTISAIGERGMAALSYDGDLSAGL